MLEVKTMGRMCPWRILSKAPYTWLTQSGSTELSVNECALDRRAVAALWWPGRGEERYTVIQGNWYNTMISSSASWRSFRCVVDTPVRQKNILDRKSLGARSVCFKERTVRSQKNATYLSYLLQSDAYISTNRCMSGPGIKSEISVRKLISALKKRRKKHRRGINGRTFPQNPRKRGKKPPPPFCQY